ncbi:hypothetical protein [Thalassotalea marina]|uniref:Sugar transporter n=1 Tax=Thalassotalea marina TaxID=1673741 RepID=A0A919EMS4_9GAMM|nr:hypothetical protein [Thalassotalea marina]GHG01202.1 hypothetical protein GCM10017161_32310 [Thalassotalea marina]
MENNSQAPRWFSVCAVLALVWNLLGLLAFISHLMLTPEIIAQFPPEQQPLYQNIPVWVTAAFALAVIGGCLGCVLLIMRNSLAKIVLILSLLGVIVQNIYSFFIIDTIAVAGPSSAVMPILVIIIAMALILMANKGQQNHWLN